MKKILAILIIVLTSCNFNYSDSYGSVGYISNLRSSAKSFAIYKVKFKGFYDTHELEFSDSVGKYNVGDSLIFIKKQ